MKILPIIVAIFLYPMALNAFGHGDGHGKGGQDGFRGGGHDGFRGGGRDGGFRGGGRDGDFRGGGRDGGFRGGGRDGGFRRDSRPGSGFRGDGRDGGFRGDSRPGSGWPKSDRLDWPKPDLLDSPKLDRPDWPVPVTPTPPFDIYKTCEPQITQLRSEKEEFMSLLQSSRSSVTTLTTEKNSLVLELSTCNQKYTSIQNDYVEITTVVKNIKSQLQEALNDNTQLKSQWIAANADSRNWKTKCDNLEIDLKRTTESYEQIKITISEYSKMISNLRSTVNEVTVNNNKCGNDNSAWKRKWEEQISKIDTYEESHKFEKITSTVDSRSRSF